ncbi:MAG: hypothetical protein DRP01_03065 [Archaeoglobales archaeon]|nr:MAG: hypothetical protein DRP01_03065 [Archaeoglobales archaeon]
MGNEEADVQEFGMHVRNSADRGGIAESGVSGIRNAVRIRANSNRIGISGSEARDKVVLHGKTEFPIHCSVQEKGVYHTLECIRFIVLPQPPRRGGTELASPCSFFYRPAVRQTAGSRETAADFFALCTVVHLGGLFGDLCDRSSELTRLLNIPLPIHDKKCKKREIKARGGSPGMRFDACLQAGL